MALNERRLTGRDVLAKTFQARTKRGYEPVEVDAYLELVAAQIDMLHGDITRAAEGAAPVRPRETEADGTIDERLDALAAELDAISAERDAFRSERDALERAHSELMAEHSTLESENGQLRAQVTAVAPPPPGGADRSEITEIAEVVELDAERRDDGGGSLPAAMGDERAVEESYELILRMARRSAEETIAEAHSRADEIVADANFTAAQISRESDRKAFEAANKVQSELASMTEQIEQRQSELERLDRQSHKRRDAMRDLASQLLMIAEDDERSLTTGESDPVLDIRPATDSGTTV